MGVGRQQVHSRIVFRLQYGGVDGCCAGCFDVDGWVKNIKAARRRRGHTQLYAVSRLKILP